jgi:hypothetical protein
MTFKAKISLREFDSNYIEEQLIWVNSLTWSKEKWKSKAALVDRNGNVTHLYTGQQFDTNYFTITDNAWTHDHCDICSSYIEEEDVCGVSEGNIICHLCFDDFVKSVETI